MIYKYKEYKIMFDTPFKRQQEVVVARKIMDLLNENKYDDLEKFIEKNKTYQDFLKNNNLTNVVKHFGNTLNEKDYIKIIENIKALSKSKQDFNKDNIKTINIDSQQFNSFKGQDKTYFINNSNSDKTIEEQMKDLQPTNEEFQTNDINKNEENLFRELEKRKQILNPVLLSEINYAELNDSQKEIFQVAYDYQQTIDSTIKVDLNNQIIIDNENNIIKIVKENDQIKVIKEENGSEKEEEIESSKNYQKQLTPSSNTIYSN